MNDPGQPGRAAWSSWLGLAGLSLVLVVSLEMLRLPAAPLLGCMAAGIIWAVRGQQLKVPARSFALAQGVVGCLIARSMQPAALLEIAHGWPVFIGAVSSVILASAALGWILMRRQVLPGATLVWGISPGAATAMTLMCESFGADTRLVAFMQFLRVLMVTVAASLVSRLWMPDEAAAAHTAGAVTWLAPVVWHELVATLAVAAVSMLVAQRVRVPGGPLLLALFLGVLLQALGVLQITLPFELLLLAYAMVGWSIGLRFTRPILEYAWHALPQVSLSILSLILICMGFAAVLNLVAGVDPLTAYLATSPGGADSVAIIAASSHVDMPFVMAMQTARFLLVLAIGPALARAVSRWQGAA